MDTETERNDFYHEKRVPIEYLPTFGTTWFIYSRNLFMVRRVPTSRSITNTPKEYSSAPNGNEPLVVMCLGRSVEPIKRFFDVVRDFADKQREAYITVRASKAQYHRESWDTTILRPIRPLSTVHFDENMKADLIADITNYLQSYTRRFYNQRGIPYRRGYLLHGPPGTGKTSLSLALAGHFGLELYLLHLPSIREDRELERLFTALPPRCIILLEDIDAVGISRQRDMANSGNEDEDDEENEEDNNKRKSSQCTLSGLLNVIDGVASQEGRIVLMTSNMAHKLDAALVRPGRIDKMIFLGQTSQRSAELMFLRMYTPDEVTSTLPDSNLTFQEGELEKLAIEFKSKIPNETFTPAQLQGYLLDKRSDPREATREIEIWVALEQAKIEKARVRSKEAAQRRARKRREAARKALMRSVKDSDLDIEDELDALEASEKRRTRVEMKDGEESGEKDDMGKKQELRSDGVETSQKKNLQTEQVELTSEPEVKENVATKSKDIGEPAEIVDGEEKNTGSRSPS